MNPLVRRASSGMALFAALITVAIASSILAGLTINAEFDVSAIQSAEWQRQVFLYQKTLEHFAVKILTLTRKIQPIDTLESPWHHSITLPINDGTTVSVYIEDLQHDFNLNNLTQFNFAAYKASRLDPKIASSFDLLQAIFQLGHYDADALSASLIDWIDADQAVSQFDTGTGAEDEYYFNRSIPLRTPNAPLESLEALQDAYGFNQTLGSGQTPLEFLKQSATALPEFTPLNVNTIPCSSIFYEAVATAVKSRIPLSSVCPAPQWKGITRVPLSDFEKLAKAPIPAYYYQSVDAFYAKLDQIAPRNPQEPSWKQLIPPNLLSVTSQYFAVDSTFFKDACQLHVRSVMKVTPPTFELVKTQMGPLRCGRVSSEEGSAPL